MLFCVQCLEFFALHAPISLITCFSKATGKISKTRQDKAVTHFIIVVECKIENYTTTLNMTKLKLQRGKTSPNTKFRKKLQYLIIPDMEHHTETLVAIEMSGLIEEALDGTMQWV